MKESQAPNTAQANKLFFLTVLLTITGTAIFGTRLGMGTNLWFNEFLYILLPPLLLARLRGWSLEEVFKFRGTSAKNYFLSVLAGVSLWAFASYFANMTRLFLDSTFGPVNLTEGINSLESSLYQIVLFLVGTVVLAPICEEIFFRGFVQAAYGRYSPKYGYVITAVLFGAYHILNGLSDVLPAMILGAAMGYLVYVTGSLAASMLFHATANLSAVLSGLFKGSISPYPAGWVHLGAAAALFLAVLTLSQVEGEPEPEQKEPLGGVLFLVLTALLFTAAGVVEILARMGRLSF
jgi:membrane protease YdiL (CAAX protease family)